MQSLLNFFYGKTPDLQIYRFSSDANCEFFPFLSRFCIYPWDIHTSKNPVTCKQKNFHDICKKLKLLFWYLKNFLKLCFRAKYMLFHIHKIKVKNFVISVTFSCILLLCEEFILFLGGSHLFGEHLTKDWKMIERVVIRLYYLWHKFNICILNQV